MVLRRIAGAIDRRSDGARHRRAILHIAAADYLSKLRLHQGRAGGEGYAGWELSNLAHPAFWSMVLLSQRRERFSMRLLGQIHVDAAAVTPYVQEKNATLEILNAIGEIDADSLIGFVDVAIHQFRPPSSSGEPLVPRGPATEIMKAALLRGAMVGELKPDAAKQAWVAANPQSMTDSTKNWKVSQGKVETLYRSWQAKRKGQGRRLV